MLKVERARHQEDRDALARAKAPRPETEALAIAWIRPSVGVIPGGDTTPRVYRGSFVRDIARDGYNLPSDISVTLIGPTLMSGGFDTYQRIVRFINGRWIGENSPILTYSLQFDYAGFNVTQYTNIPSPVRRSIALPLYGQLSSGTAQTNYYDLPVVRLGNPQYDHGISPSRNFLYDFALGYDIYFYGSGYDVTYVNYGDPPVVYLSTTYGFGHSDMLTRTFGDHRFSVAKVGHRYRLVHSFRLARAFSRDSPYQTTNINAFDGAGFNVYRWGDAAVDSSGRSVIDFAAHDAYDYFKYNVASDQWDMTPAPPDDAAGPAHYSTVTGSAWVGNAHPWSTTPAFGTYALRLTSSPR